MNLSQPSRSRLTEARMAAYPQPSATPDKGPLRVPQSLWDEAACAGFSEIDRLLYRSNLLGSDLSVTNFGGGNTSAKLTDRDPLSGEAVEVLWVKGSGGDLGSMQRDGFATLYLDRVRGLERLYRGLDFEDEMVGLLPHCTFGLNPRAASIDTPLHAFIPHRHVDHLHPDAVVAIAAIHESRSLTEAVYGDAVGWIGWQRPGFDLGLRMGELLAAHPHWRGMVLEGHGLFCWGETARDCYETSIDLIARAATAINARIKPRPAPAVPAADDLLRRATRLLRPLLTGAKIACRLDTPDVRDFVSSPHLLQDVSLGAPCPDHFLRTKPWPLILDPQRLLAEDAAAYVAEAVAGFRRRYQAYYERFCTPGSPAMRDADPVIVLIRDTGALAFAPDATQARIAGEYALNTMNVITGARALGHYKPLDEREAFAIEYWALEEAKLKRQPKPGELAGRVACITGAAGGIGRAVAEDILAKGGCVLLTDIDAPRLEAARLELATRFRPDLIRTFVADIGDEAQVMSAFEATFDAFGAIDILVANAGIATAASIEDTTLDLWQQNFRVLADGYFLPAREAFRAMKAGGGGSIVFVVSKNAVAASGGASAYASAKAAELHLARCLALEGAPHGIRVNVVNPDAVLQGSHIWNGEWRSQRAAAYDLKPDELEDFYRQRSLLKREVLPQDVARAVVFLASDAAAKSTGNILNVDAGHAAAFTR
ncbi:bifunctional rhamnulose-1-phosphate aldolase/short-chain dehydrogenase [Asticcacaulis sp. EMRT-3]|uniref:bifunctional rhamnulose-1-phosphate aldolase/short-chain dehydrogenase n=1 Tax=Asticcacaulis sp. EMRT-3 TaxID=3040349 RepID=UPI0024AFCD46|nr:bifunctional rhamnulose-1-phosphate aldolase/short-chain dehydrogenase [Asticcacaulis sp. EMRT-3]MDI7776418.1 bifunctional rhamnulose-1-phosphate aldolase/short-chain dehydrogenase [Asticcacaulis sp. EMRT-3]